MPYKGYTESLKKSALKYQKEHLEPITMRFHKGVREQLHKLAAEADMSFAELFKVAITEFAGRNGYTAPDFSAPSERAKVAGGVKVAKVETVEKLNAES